MGFSQLCTRLWRLKKESLNQLPKMWLQQILVAIAGLKEENSKLCATRRSAGVPFMIQVSNVKLDFSVKLYYCNT